MKFKLNYLLIKLSLLILISFSCKSFKVSDLDSKKKLINTLPALIPKIELGSLERTYLHGSRKFITVRYQGKAYQAYFKKDKHNKGPYIDYRIDDIISCFENEITNNICHNLEDKYGYMSLELLNGGSKEIYKLLPYLSGLSLYSLNILGMPLWGIKTELEIKVSIYDSKKKLISSYTSIGSHSTSIAFWYGYKIKSALKKSNIEAFKKALNSIKIELDSDHKKLTNHLLETGKIGE